MELIQQDLKFYIPKQGKFSDFSESTDVIIPDSYPDFEETVFSCATINVKDELKQAERILVSGQLDAVVLYRGSDKTLHRLNIPLSFAHVEETKGIPHGTLHFMQYAVLQTDVRIINSRKINITCTCIVKPRFLQQTFCSLTTDVTPASAELQIQRHSQTIRTISGAETMRFVILDDLEMQENIADILHTNVCYHNVSCSVSNNRVVINGTVQFQVWWLSDDSSITCRNYDIPFHQIHDTRVLSENTPTEVMLSCHSTIWHHSNDHVLSVNFNTEALLLQQTEQEVRWISDLYDLKNDLQLDFKPITLQTIDAPISFHCSGKETFTLPSNFSHIISSQSEVSAILPPENGTFKAILSCSVLFSNDSGQPYQFKRQFPVQFPCEQNISANTLFDIVFSCEPQMQQNELVLRINGTGTLSNYTPFTVRNLEELTIAPTPTQEQHPLKILYLKEPTSLWNIAKENKSTVSAIIQHNALSENTDSVSNAVLLVP